MVSTRGGGDGGGAAPRRAAAPRAAAPRAAKAQRSGGLAPPPAAARPESDGFFASDEIIDQLLECVAGIDPRAAVALLSCCRRFRRLGASNAAVWRKMVMSSPYADLLPRLDAASMMASNPLQLASRLLSRRCGYCGGVGEYWFTLQCRRVCLGCFELDIQQGVTRTEYPTADLSVFLTPQAPAAAAAEDEAGPSAAAAVAPVTSSVAPAAGGAAAARRPPLCAYVSKSMAKTLFCLGDKELNALRCLTLTGEDAKRTGVAISANAKVTLVTAGDCLDAAVARFGSQEALVAEQAARRAKAQAAAGEKRAEGKAPAPSPYLKGTCNFPHLNQSRHGIFSQHSGFGLEYAVRSPFFALPQPLSGGRLLRVAVPRFDHAPGADFVSFAAAMSAAKAGDVVELLPGSHDVDAGSVYDEENPGAYVRKAITIIGRRGADGQRPVLYGGSRVLCVVNSCAVRSVSLVSTRGSYGNEAGYISTVLVTNCFAQESNRDLCVCFEDCELRVPLAINPSSFGMSARAQNGAPSGRTRLELSRCISGRVRHTGDVTLVVDAASHIGSIATFVADDD